MNMINKKEFEYPITLFHAVYIQGSPKYSEIEYLQDPNGDDIIFNSEDDLETGIYIPDDYDLWIVDEDKTTYITDYERDNFNLHNFERILYDLYEVQKMTLKKAIPIANDITVL